MSLATIRESPGLDAYLEGLEERLAAAVEACPGLVATVGAEALAAGGKRLRPLLVFLTAPKDTDPLPAGAAVELVHTATLVHDDLIDRAEYRRGRASAWACHGPPAARAAGDYLFARAFAELADTGDHQAVSFLAGATLALARGEALQRAQTRDPETSVESYLERCALKTGVPRRPPPPSRARSADRRRGGPRVVIRLGRISYVNMAPVFFRLEAEVDEVQGVPTDLNARLLAGELDLAPISSIEYARNADRL